METAAASSDKGIGLTILFALVAILGVGGMFAAGLSGDQLIAAVGFAVAVVGGSLSVSATHLFE